jgi:hypothetical protein
MQQAPLQDFTAAALRLRIHMDSQERMFSLAAAIQLSPFSAESLSDYLTEIQVHEQPPLNMETDRVLGTSMSSASRGPSALTPLPSRLRSSLVTLSITT